MKTLIIDTSSEYCLLALSEGDSIATHTLFLHANRLSQSLLPDISTLIAQAGWVLKDINRIVVGVGPGSYTGTRIGVAVARSLSYGLNTSLRGFCSLTAFLPSAIGTFASVLPAKSGLFYLLTGDKLKKIININRAELVSPTELQDIFSRVDFVTARCDNELSPDLKISNFLPFQPNPDNIILTLQAPPTYPFETDTQLIYMQGM